MAKHGIAMDLSGDADQAIRSFELVRRELSLDDPYTTDAEWLRAMHDVFPRAYPIFDFPILVDPSLPPNVVEIRGKNTIRVQI